MLSAEAQRYLSEVWEYSSIANMDEDTIFNIAENVGLAKLEGKSYPLDNELWHAYLEHAEAHAIGIPMKTIQASTGELYREKG